MSFAASDDAAFKIYDEQFTLLPDHIRASLKYDILWSTGIAGDSLILERSYCKIFVMNDDKKRIEKLENEKALLLERLSDYEQRFGIIHDEPGEPADVTQNVREARSFQRILDDFFDSLPLMVFLKSAKDLRFIRCNKAGEEVTGYPSEMFIGKNDYDFFPKEDADFFTAKDRQVLQDKKPLDIPIERVHNAAGEERLLHTRKVPILDSEGNPLYLLGISEDVTEQVKSSEELKKIKKWLDSFLESTADGLSIYDAELNLVVINEKASEYFSDEVRNAGLVGRNFWDLLKYHPDPDFLKPIVENVLETGTPYDHDESILVGDKELWANLRIFRIGKGIGFVSSDITEKKNLEEKLFQIQKIESIGKFAGGIAHDFNNFLGAIIGHAELAMLDNKDETCQSHLTDILKAAERSAQLTRQLLAFARKQNISPRIMNLNAAIDGIQKMLKSLIGDSIEVAWEPAEDLWKVRMDPSQIDQLIVNLCVNARDAIEGSGRILIKTENIFIDESYCSYHPESTVGEYICLSVNDNGKGMDKKTQSMIFEPFFTTKEAGKGTGLGLATVHGIVKQNKGFINIYSEPGYGTTMKIFIPGNISGDIEVGKLDRKAAEQGNETVLLIEDDPSMLEMTSIMLESLGYKVIGADSPGKALQIVSGREQDIDLVLCDVIMPHMNGRLLMDRLLEIDPGLRYMFMSGYTDDVISQYNILEEGIHLIEKPFTRTLMATRIREILDE